MRRSFFSLFFLLLISPAAWGKPLVVTSFSILADMVHQIGQDKIEVATLVGPNQDAHVFEPRPQHVKLLEKADLLITNGLGFENWLDRLIRASGFKGTLAIATKGVEPLHYTEHGHTIPDPHAWHSLKNALLYVDNVVDALSRLIPEEKAFFEAKGKAYKAELELLRKEIDQKLASVPLEQRKVLTNHDAFEYLGRDFHISFYSPLGMSTEAEASAKAIVTLIHKIREEGINAVFVENILNPRLIEQIARETGSHIAGSLYSDALDVPDTSADTYLSMMRSNLHALADALKASAASLTSSPTS